MVPQVLEHRELAVKARMLEDHPQVPANQRRVPAEVMAPQAYNTRGWRHERRKNLKERRFPPTIGAEQSEHLAASDGKTHPAKGLSVAIDMAQIFDFNSWRGFTSVDSRRTHLHTGFLNRAEEIIKAEPKALRVAVEQYGEDHAKAAPDMI